MYDADDRRFMAVDPIKDGLNHYVYCSNNPIRYTDPTGLWKEEVHEELTDDAMDQLMSEGLYDRVGNKITKGVKNEHVKHIKRGNVSTDTFPYGAAPPSNFFMHQGRHLNIQPHTKTMADTGRESLDSRRNWARIEMQEAVRKWREYSGPNYDAFVKYVCRDPEEVISFHHRERINALEILGRGLHSIQDIDAHMQLGGGDIQLTYHNTKNELIIAPSEDIYSFFDNKLFNIEWKVNVPVVVPVDTVSRYDREVTIYKTGYYATEVASKWENPRYTRSIAESVVYLREFYSQVDTSQKTAAQIKNDIERLIR